MTRRRLIVSADAAAEADRVWQVLTDWERHDEWMFATDAVGGTGTGARVEAWTGIGPVGFRDVMIITGWHPPRAGRRGRCIVRHTGSVVRGVGRFEVLPLIDRRCRVIWTEDLDVPFGLLGEVGWICAGPVARAVLRHSLRRLTRLVADR